MKVVADLVIRKEQHKVGGASSSRSRILKPRQTYAPLRHIKQGVN